MHYDFKPWFYIKGVFPSSYQNLCFSPWTGRRCCRLLRWTAVLERWTGLSLAPVAAWPCWSPSLTNACVSLLLTETIPTVTPSAISPPGSTPVSLHSVLVLFCCCSCSAINGVQICFLQKLFCDLLKYCRFGKTWVCERLSFYFTPSTFL